MEYVYFDRNIQSNILKSISDFFAKYKEYKFEKGKSEEKLRNLCKDFINEPAGILAYKPIKKFRLPCDTCKKIMFDTSQVIIKYDPTSNSSKIPN